MENKECPICLSTYTNKTVLDGCYHAYCFDCILKWSTNTLSCPLCKTKLTIAYHSIEQDYSHSIYEFEKKSSRMHFIRRPLDPNGALQKRKQVYIRGIKAKPQPLTPQSKFKDTKPINFSSDPHQLTLLKPWICRELQAILGIQDVELILEYILALLKTVDLKSDQGLAALSEYLGESCSELFVHELFCFAKSFLNMEAYDQVVEY